MTWETRANGLLIAGDLARGRVPHELRPQHRAADKSLGQRIELASQPARPGASSTYTVETINRPLVRDSGSRCHVTSTARSGHNPEGGSAELARWLPHRRVPKTVMALTSHPNLSIALRSGKRRPFAWPRPADEVLVSVDAEPLRASDAGHR